jgi:hypothetical protein
LLLQAERQPAEGQQLPKAKPRSQPKPKAPPASGSQNRTPAPSPAAAAAATADELARVRQLRKALDLVAKLEEALQVYHGHQVGAVCSDMQT